jgi:ribosomal protein S16
VHKAERNQHIFLVVISDRKKNKAGKELESFTFYQAIMADFLEEVMIQAQY